MDDIFTISADKIGKVADITLKLADIRALLPDDAHTKMQNEGSRKALQHKIVRNSPRLLPERDY